MNQPFDIPTVDLMNDLLPAYKFISLLASGDHEAVYVASQKSLDRHVAIKVYAPQLSGDKVFTSAFRGMAYQMASLNHLNLIGVFDSGTVQAMHYLVMEFVPGQSLWQAFEGAAQEPPVVASLIEGICNGLCHAHGNGILHGGLSLSSILINQKGEPKIGNFGYLASVPEALDSPWKRFFAPEIINGTGGLSVRSDIYSLGAIYYELVTGQPHGPDAMPPHLVAGVGEQVYEVWRKATAADPLLRHASVEEFKQECLAALPKPRAARAMAKAPHTGRGVASARTAGQVSKPAPSAVPTIHKVGFNWKLLRNLIIIAILLYAINLAWNRYQNQKAHRAKLAAEALAEKQQRDADKRAKEAAELAERKRQWEQMQQAQRQDEPPPPEPEPAPVAPQKVENPLAALDRLKDQLVAGGRSEMPPGTKEIGSGHFLFVNQPMSWPDAAWTAEKYGGQLAVPTTEATMQVLRESVMAGAGDEIWIGAARNGLDSWALISGTRWLPASEPQGEGIYVAVTAAAELRGCGPADLRPFIIAWNKDGSRPGSLDALVATTRKTIDSGHPFYPPGTRTFGVRNYLYVSRPVDWQTAAQIAKAAGGHLMVVRGIAENYNLERMTAGILVKDGIWLGGVGSGQQWTWTSGEPWGKGNWSDSAAPAAAGKALALQPGTGWVARDVGRPASGFIIEWSPDAAGR